MRSRLTSFGVVAFVLLVVSGCTQPGPTSADLNSTNLKRLHSAYTIFWTSHAYRGPKDEQAFKKFLTSDAGAKIKLGRIGVSADNIDDIFVGERDGKPLIVKYGINGPGDLPVIFESEGVDGRRFVAYASPKELSDADYKATLEGKSKPAGKIGGDF